MRKDPPEALRLRQPSHCNANWGVPDSPALCPVTPARKPWTEVLLLNGLAPFDPHQLIKSSRVGCLVYTTCICSLPLLPILCHELVIIIHLLHLSSFLRFWVLSHTETQRTFPTGESFQHLISSLSLPALGPSGERDRRLSQRLCHHLLPQAHRTLESLLFCSPQSPYHLCPRASILISPLTGSPLPSNDARILPRLLFPFPLPSSPCRRERGIYRLSAVSSGYRRTARTHPLQSTPHHTPPLPHSSRVGLVPFSPRPSAFA